MAGADVNAVRELFCDMDGVLVNQTSRQRFDLMGWHPGGRRLWAHIAPFRPTILSQLQPDIYNISKPEKEIWCARELGPDVPVIVVRAQNGKWPHAHPGAVLIDDSQAHGEPWIKHGGIFVHHLSVDRTIVELRKLGWG